MDFKFSKSRPDTTGVLIVPVFDENTLGPNAKQLDAELGGGIKARLDSKDKFKGKPGQSLSLTIDEAYGAKEILLIGMGKANNLNENSVRAIGASLKQAVAATQEDSATLLLDKIKGQSLSEELMAAHLLDSMQASAYTFNKYRKNANDNAGIAALSLDAIVKNPERAEEAYSCLKAITDSVNWARDLGNEPPNILTPAAYAKRISEELQQFPNVKVKILEEDDMQARNMGGILAVTQGSTTNPARMVVIEYDGTNGQQERPLGLVGKGVTFDTGGYNLKPGMAMTGMKMDMCGSANVVGAMRALAARGANVHTVAVVGLAENMVDGASFRPEDVITMMNGKTVEIGNTDAEGRLILADALTYIQQEYEPHILLDFATLTGAMLVALGDTYTGVFPNDDNLWSALKESGHKSGEPGWRMPVLNEAFSKAMTGSISDLSNTGSMRFAGASTAAAFLNQFIEKDESGNDKVKWAHFDIAGTSKQGSLATGIGVRWLDEFVRQQYESDQPTLDFSAKPESKYG